MNLRDELLEGRCDANVATALGSALARWHAATRSGDLLPRELQDLDAFVKLRIDPFYRFVAARNPDLAAGIDLAVEGLLTSRSCLVHGDFSPKNILIAQNRSWVLDWEVAHFGNPVFDLAFMLTHLLLKTIHRPRFAVGYESFARAFLTAYRDVVDPVPPHAPDDEIGLNLACLLLARAEGKSPAAYLTDEEADRARSLSLDLFRRRPTAALEAWGRL